MAKSNFGERDRAVREISHNPIVVSVLALVLIALFSAPCGAKWVNPRKSHSDWLDRDVDRWRKEYKTKTPKQKPAPSIPSVPAPPVPSAPKLNRDGGPFQPALPPQPQAPAMARPEPRGSSVAPGLTQPVSPSGSRFGDRDRQDTRGASQRSSEPDYWKCGNQKPFYMDDD